MKFVHLPEGGVFDQACLGKLNQTWNIPSLDQGLLLVLMSWIFEDQTQPGKLKKFVFTKIDVYLLLIMVLQLWPPLTGCLHLILSSRKGRRQSFSLLLQTKDNAILQRDPCVLAFITGCCIIEYPTKTLAGFGWRDPRLPSELLKAASDLLGAWDCHQCQDQNI